MTIKEAIGKVMVNLDEVTGHDLVLNVEEFEPKMPPLFDSVQREIATVCCQIEKWADVEIIDETVMLPVDCYEILGLYDNDMKHVSYVKKDKTLKVGKRIGKPELVLHYNAYPKRIDHTTPSDYEFEIDQEAQEAMIFGVCAGICINDEPELYDTYMDRYNVILANILQRKQEQPKAAVLGGFRF